MTIIYPFLVFVHVLGTAAGLIASLGPLAARRSGDPDTSRAAPLEPVPQRVVVAPALLVPCPPGSPEPGSSSSGGVSSRE